MRASQYRPLRGSSFDVGGDEEEDLPAWSDDEDDHVSEAKTLTSVLRKAGPKNEEAESSATGGDQLVRPSSSLERRGSALNEPSSSTIGKSNSIA